MSSATGAVNARRSAIAAAISAPSTAIATAASDSVSAWRAVAASIVPGVGRRGSAAASPTTPPISIGTALWPSASRSIRPRPDPRSLSRPMSRRRSWAPCRTAR